MKKKKTHTTSYPVILGQLIARHREIQCMSQAKLGKKLDVGQSIVSRIENGVLRLTIGQLFEIATALNTTPRFLVGRAEELGSFFQHRNMRVEYQHKSTHLDASTVGSLIKLETI